MSLIFLDFDGVMIPNPPHGKKGDKLRPFTREASQNLKSILDVVPDATVVISSSWRNDVDAVIKAFRAAGLPVERISGFTRYEDDDGAARGVQIKDYLRKFLDEPSYVILDDAASFLQEQEPHIVKIESQVGLTAMDAARAVRILES